jgi:predicted Kef-type K+ transport protein
VVNIHDIEQLAEIGVARLLFGLWLAIGAFVAGLVINESEYVHQALSDVMPLRDLFGMLFFVSVGMLLDPGLVWAQVGPSRYLPRHLLKPMSVRLRQVSALEAVLVCGRCAAA